ncbi:RNA polymerase sigma factor [Schlesneria paludicola]|uniref:RNA polymerase sigma factor n=1 Tax=Schlesneria paludicola TaxID=360056 RepID=UPI00029A6835|nr:sigma-70 family RNA polymerase sigma factor [Schlesneria paludicola]
MTTRDAFDDQDRLEGSTSLNLLSAARRGQPGAWERLVRLYAPLVASWCRNWGIAEQDFVDILQDVFLSVSGHLKNFRKVRPSDTFRGWLFTIARNKARDHFRRTASQPIGEGGSEANQRLQQSFDPHVEVEQVDAMDDAAMDTLLQNALNVIRKEFHAKTWQAFWSVVIEGRLAADVAADLNMTPGAVRVAKSRVLLRLRQELGDAPGS